MGLFDAFRAKTPAEQLRENKRMIDRAIRELDRERQRMEMQEKKTIAEMKKLAKAGQKVCIYATRASPFTVLFIRRPARFWRRTLSGHGLR